MELHVYRISLQEKHKNLNCYNVEFKHFKESVQKAIKVVGSAIFHDEDTKPTLRGGYQAILPN
jgi:hypothetical protein